MDDPLSVLGIKVIPSRHVKWGQMLVSGAHGQAVLVHGLQPLLTDESAARMRSEAPADAAARIVAEVLQWHADGPDRAMAEAARAEMTSRGLT